ncbi:MAG TPA: nitroreductase family protein [Anaerolineaceae bacterium]|jgi:nitroreductase|nr:nitroreductase family protein [Anaerolineales bacterium]HOG59359.1 nitroreductase family protein [Anaerolineaceae bacterium]HOR83708.1 nitroreductase family protein [Anaerolineaceae bacterium]HPL43852.1 nitroreductase family protein [Anaerolineaceae bacterium]HPY33597.1 nitroreductase family protein [Anaerolineaceae bacterium]
MKVSEIKVRDYRKNLYPVEDFIIQRWSARAMSGEALPQEELLRLFEAARWAPSSGNFQEWFFLYAHRGTEQFDGFFSLLDIWNQEWCARASVLLVVLSNRISSKGKEISTHAFDTGMAFENLALQGTAMGLVVHPMAGFNYERARAELRIPDAYSIHCMAAVGYPGEINQLSEYNQNREYPNQRKDLKESFQEGGFPPVSN